MSGHGSTTRKKRFRRRKNGSLIQSEKSKKKEKKIWDAGCDKFKVTEKLEDLDERIELVSDYLNGARKRYPKYFGDDGL